MKKFFSILGLTLGVILGGYSQGLVTQSFTIPLASTATNLINGGCKINQIVVTVGSTVGAGSWTYFVVDAPETNAFGEDKIVFPVGAYAGIGQYLTNITRVSTQYSGLLQTNIYTNSLYTYTNTVAATSNLYRIDLSGTVSTNTTITIPIGSPLYHGFGLTWSNNPPATGMIVTVTYDPSL